MPKILIVEDKDDVREEIERGVAGDGHQVTGVAGGAAALEAIARCAPDLIVLDLQLPDVGGIELCQRIRQDERRMPILILTVTDDILTKVTGFESGADNYVTKPFKMPELLARIRRHTARFLSAVSGRESVRDGRRVLKD